VSPLDWIIIALFLAGLIAMSLYLGRDQHNQDDYYVGGRVMPWWAVGLSTMATQTSAISFISIPAFVALKPGGGFTWLQYELAVPLAMIGTSILLLPFFRSLRLISVYAYLELRFGPAVRTLISLLFLLGRALGTGVGLYASAIVLTVMLSLPLWLTILMMGMITIIYDTIGGMKAVVYSDVVQMVILLAGIVLCISFAMERAGGLQATLNALPSERWQMIDPGTGLGDGSATPFWGFLLGGLFLYMSYYGTDQSQVQRELSAATLAGTRNSLYFNGFFRFPFTMLYIVLGLALGAVYATSPEFRSEVPLDRMDFLVPVFILQHLPEGVRGILTASLLAASMSSLDSALNSLSAATMRDFVEKNRQLSERRSLLLGKVTTVLWGCLITGFAFLVGNISDTVIESINKIGSTVYGPILAAFIAGVLTECITSRGIFLGVLAGIGFNLMLWIGFPGIFWMWWNLFGFAVTLIVGVCVSRVAPAPVTQRVRSHTLAGSGLFRTEPMWRCGHTLLLLYFFIMLGFMLAANHVLSQAA
jgi:SSS family transporter